jgi:hypothetical protein
MATIKALNLLDEPATFQNENAYEQKNYNWAQLRSYGPYLATFLTNSLADYDARINNLIKGVSQPSEVVDARLSANGTQYPTLKAHLDNIDNSKTSYEDVAEIAGVAETIRLTDIGANSAPIKIATSAEISKTNTDTNEGLVVMATSNLTLTEGA